MTSSYADHWALYAAIAVSILLMIVIAIRSGRNRRRMSAAFLYLACLGICGVLVAAGMIVDEWMHWNSRNTLISAAVAQADPASVTITDNIDYVTYEIKNPSSGILATKWIQYEFGLPEMLIGDGVVFGALLALIAIVLRAIVVRRMGDRLKEGHCYTCGYNLTGNESGACPECGDPVQRLAETSCTT